MAICSVGDKGRLVVFVSFINAHIVIASGEVRGKIGCTQHSGRGNAYKGKDGSAHGGYVIFFGWGLKFEKEMSKRRVFQTVDALSLILQIIEVKLRAVT